MKSPILISVLLILASSPLAHAAIWKCGVDPERCPSGKHIHCVGYGWCGPDCDYCQTGSEPVREEAQALDAKDHDCNDCYSQPRPSQYCRTSCGCTSAFCGAW